MAEVPAEIKIEDFLPICRAELAAMYLNDELSFDDYWRLLEKLDEKTQN